MISITEALNIIKNNLPRSAVEAVALEGAAEKYLAEDIYAPESSPRFSNSAMDGYAVRWSDVKSASETRPASLDIIGESQAGTPFSGTVETNCAIRISTGAMVPDSIDTVIRVEDTSEEGERLIIHTVRQKGQDIRHQGEEFKKGDFLLHRGTKLSAPQIALLSAVGISKVSVYRSCRVALLVTGDELVAAGQEIMDHQIRDSNMAMLTTAIRESGGETSLVKRVPDEYQATVEAIEKADADIIICTGGVSVGRHDHVKEAAEENGFDPLFWRIRQKPGKPLYFARKNNILLFGLPGNPVSAFMCFIHYVRPTITTMAGQSFGWPTVSAQAIADISNAGKRTTLMRVKITWRQNEGYCIAGVHRQGSHMLTSLSDADGYIIIEPGMSLKKGDRTDVYRYEFRRETV